MEVRWLGALAEVEARDWDALRPDDNPFAAHAFLNGLEQQGCLRPAWGWRPHHAALFQGGRLRAAAPCYLKHNSHGEFVFDHAWAEAYHQHGLEYYPKLLCAVPYSPVPGPRLLGGSGPDQHQRRTQLAAALSVQAHALGLSSVHLNFGLASDVAAIDAVPVPSEPAGAAAPPAHAPWLRRHDWQFHWHQRGWRDFDDFLDALTAKKRKNIRQERGRVRGVEVDVLHGDEATEADLDAMHALYAMAFLAKGNAPALTRSFLGHLARAMPRQLLLVLARRRGRTVAGALCLRSSSTLYGRYWGSEVDVPGLHFELCYYQGIEYCLRHGLTRFEPGAQGEHKLARGFLPVATHSRHLLLQPAFQRAAAEWLDEERRWLAHYRAGLQAHSPFRSD